MSESVYSIDKIKKCVTTLLPNKVLFALGDKEEVMCASMWINQLQQRLDEAEKVIGDLVSAQERMFIQLNRQRRDLVYMHNSDEPSVTKDNLRADALVIASNIGLELDGKNFWNIKPALEKARAYQAKCRERK